MTEALDAVMNQPRRVRMLSDALQTIQGGIQPLVDLYRPYVSGLDKLPADGRFLLVGNHTQQAQAEILLIPHYVRRVTGTRVRPLADRKFGQAKGLGRDLIAAYGGIVGARDTAGELMRHNETILVFPGGGREIAKFKGEEYQLNWRGRSGFARLAVEHDYPIVPVGLVGGDDVYKSLVTRDSRMGRLSQAVSKRLSGDADMVMPLLRGIGPTLIPRPQRMYLRFGDPIDTTKPEKASADSWVTTVRDNTQRELEAILRDLLALRADDPFRELNPLAWSRAVAG
ncbi:lysophospholipid acyltransferase family protein [Mycobacterium gordonae]|jgi:1-acyl-sn-glycerol-3-phosphate acyltransferase|uniref:Glycerol acyltransferase n=1 Tax=Mycobacterium gordonae TaxID=1778 RepID=A0A1A6BCA8_MYCGO|nr:lysophospholipid acyltransferase family protein [Mycobacterium gordonae]MBX9982495.1 acyltransferase family protein [Mycobacterium gordonae]MCQ4361580.1 acyltransferase family protein [Mycobacterium gordonae]MCV7006830.1 acyltransferase family protein [Mycobacterium gordonae]OBR99883.1 glycerol acyltransferase [Mycobacterium gordonae]ODR24383.1 glycerol acyltransferase [Mycobacterium gordonae]